MGEGRPRMRPVPEERQDAHREAMRESIALMGGMSGKQVREIIYSASGLVDIRAINVETKINGKEPLKVILDYCDGSVVTWEADPAPTAPAPPAAPPSDDPHS